MSDRLDAATRDEIDDRVAEALDVYLAEKLAEPGALDELIGPSRGAVVLLGSILLGAVVTAVASSMNVVVLCMMWIAIAVADLGWFLTGQRHTR
ncbi:hypothetical protein [Amycolatopsis sp. H20-H5]|uniref:hypothetical protein n=1 Tax=Amycolatopsis sp. H20-H5 TaxID=3046309 RepID=UPI002DBB06C7|nr:hypothetical protein [Amycolatopsis sp. H20-H5]MEC3975279.1 hypothetical protein [Amycolatopsis sp. H20-H5]